VGLLVEFEMVPGIVVVQHAETERLLFGLLDIE